MNRTPHQILTTLDSARKIAAELKIRLSRKDDVTDLGDLARIQTEVGKVEELLKAAAEHECALRDRLRQAAARIGVPRGVDSADAPQRKVGFLKDKINVPADFDGPLPDEILDDFEGLGPES